MRRALLTVAAVLLLGGCAADSSVPGAGPTAVPTTTSSAPPTQGPTTGRTIALGAFVSPDDLGEGWTSGVAAAAPCRPAFAHTAMRSVGLAEDRGTLTETIATQVDIGSAVTAWRTALSGCGFDVRDDALGDAGLSALSRDGRQRLLVTGTEGVLVVLHAQGELAQEVEEMDAWADLALGTSCVAAPDGCH